MDLETAFYEFFKTAPVSALSCLMLWVVIRQTIPKMLEDNRQDLKEAREESQSEQREARQQFFDMFRIYSEQLSQHRTSEEEILTKISETMARFEVIAVRMVNQNGKSEG